MEGSEVLLRIRVHCHYDREHEPPGSTCPDHRRRRADPVRYRRPVASAFFSNFSSSFLTTSWASASISPDEPLFYEPSLSDWITHAHALKTAKWRASLPFSSRSPIGMGLLISRSVEPSSTNDCWWITRWTCDVTIAKIPISRHDLLLLKEIKKQKKKWKSYYD